MTTPLIMLAILVAPYWFILTLRRLRPTTRVDPVFGARLGLALLFVFTETGHFAETLAMAEMLPPSVPSRVELVYATGVFEIALALVLLVRGLQRVAGWTAIAMLVGFLPVNIYAAVHHIEMGGHAWGPSYLYIRVPLQLVLIAWAWVFFARSR